MAEWCLDCHDQLFGHDLECGLAGLISEKKVKEGYVINVLCEGCGFISVDHTGKKVSWPYDMTPINDNKQKRRE